MGCLAAAFAQAVSGIGKAIVVGIAVFVFGRTDPLAKASSFHPKIKVLELGTSGRKNKIKFSNLNINFRFKSE